MNENENNNRRRLLVPVVAIMLVAVALLGVGYALTSTVTNTGNEVGVDKLSVDFYEDPEGNIQVTSAIIDAHISYCTNIDTGVTVNKVDISDGWASDDEGLTATQTFTWYVKITDTRDSQIYTLSAESLPATAGDGVTIAYTLDSIDISEGGMKADAAKDTVYAVTATVTVDAELANTTSPDTISIDNIKFSVTPN